VFHPSAAACWKVGFEWATSRKTYCAAVRRAIQCHRMAAPGLATLLQKPCAVSGKYQGRGTAELDMIYVAPVEVSAPILVLPTLPASPSSDAPRYREILLAPSPPCSAVPTTQAAASAKKATATTLTRLFDAPAGCSTGGGDCSIVLKLANLLSTKERKPSRIDSIKNKNGRLTFRRCGSGRGITLLESGGDGSATLHLRCCGNLLGRACLRSLHGAVQGGMA
jgi:hypothetical protein